MSKKYHFFSYCPHLVNEGGHDFTYHLTLQKIMQRNQIEYRALITQGINFNKLTSEWTPFFRGEKWRIIDFVRSFFLTSGQRIFFLESFNGKDLCALVLAALLFARKQDRIWILFRYGKDQLPMNGRLHLFLAKLLRKKLKERFVALTDSDLIRRSFEPHLSMKVMPIPHTEVAAPFKKMSTKLTMWWPGVPRPAKGVEEIKRLMLLSSPGEMELVLAQSVPLPSEPRLKVRQIPNILSREQYLEQMQEADIVLLPYDPDTYRSGTSGILVEAIIAGKMPLVKQGSWLSYELQRFSLEELIIDWSRKDLMEHILLLHQDQTVQAKLEKMKQEYTQFHSIEGYEAILKKLIFSKQPSLE